MKVVINKCFGGFSLSEKAIRRYAEIMGKTIYFENYEKYPDMKELGTFWLVPPEQRPKPIENWINAPLEDRQAYNKAHEELTIGTREFDRHDGILVQVVEELGDEANGRYAKLEVIEIPDNVDYEISEYDGMEHIAEKHRTWG